MCRCVGIEKGLQRMPPLPNLLLLLSVYLVFVVSENDSELGIRVILLLGETITKLICGLVGDGIDKLFFHCLVLFIYGGSKYGDFPV